MRLVKAVILSFWVFVLVAASLQFALAGNYKITVNFIPTSADVYHKPPGESDYVKVGGGSSPVYISTTLSGSHVVRVMAAGYETQDQAVDVDNQMPEVILNFTLTPLGPAEVESVSASPNPAQPEWDVTLTASLKGNLSNISKVEFSISVGLKVQDETINPYQFSSKCTYSGQDAQQSPLSCVWHTQSTTTEGVHVARVVLTRTEPPPLLVLKDIDVTIDKDATPPDDDNGGDDGDGDDGGGAVAVATFPPPVITPASAPGTLGEVFDTILIFMIALSGGILLIVLAVGGIQYLSSSGNEEVKAKAKKTLLYAVIGFIIVLAAYALTNYLINVFT